MEAIKFSGDNKKSEQPKPVEKIAPPEAQKKVSSEPLERIIATPTEKPIPKKGTEKISEEELDKSFNKNIVSSIFSKNKKQSSKPEDGVVKKTKMAKLIKIAALLVVVLAVAFGVLTVTDNVYLLNGGLPKDAKRALGIVYGNMENSKSLHLEGTMNFDLAISSDVSADISNKEQIKYDVKGDMELPDKSHLYLTVAQSSIPFLAGTSSEIIVIGKKSYLKLNMPEGGFDDDSWIDLDSASEDTKISADFDPSLLNNNYLRFIKEARVVEDDGATTHYYITVDSSKALESGEFERFKKTNDEEVIDKFEVTEDVWVEKQSKLIIRQTANISMATKNSQTGLAMEKIDAILDFNLSEFGKTIALSAPEKIKDLGTLDESVLNSKKNDARRVNDLVVISQALAAYNKDHSGYPSTEMKLVKLSDTENIVAKELRPKYLTVLPADPGTGGAFYGYRSDGKTYELTAALENQNDPLCLVEGNLCLLKIKNGEVVSKK